MKFIKYIFFIIWTIWCFVGIIKNYSHYKFADWISISFFVMLPYIIMILISAKRKKTYKDDITDDITASVAQKTTPFQNINTQSIEKSDKALLNEDTSIKLIVDNSYKSNSLSDTQTLVDDFKDQSIAYIETGNTIQRVDGQPITDEEVPYLIQLGYETAVLAEKNSSNPKFHKTEREENLSFNFIEKYGPQVDNLTEKFESAYENAYKTKDLDERILLLNESLKAFEKAKKFCYSKGKGGTIYFQDMWEHLHNSQNECFSYLNNIEDSLEECIFQRDIAIPKIIAIITCTPGILQKNIYRHLPNIDKPTIQRTIKYLECENKISRTKKGNSYELHINE